MLKSTDENHTVTEPVRRTAYEQYRYVQRLEGTLHLCIKALENMLTSWHDAVGGDVGSTEHAREALKKATKLLPSYEPVEDPVPLEDHKAVVERYEELLSRRDTLISDLQLRLVAVPRTQNIIT